ncbi:MAG: caspase family protein, partial [Blastocatellia bacterium]
MTAKLNAIFIFFAMLLTAGAQQLPNREARTWALVIGVSKYQKLPGGQQLQFADRDAALFAEAIQKRGVSPQNVRLLTGAEATTAAIKSSIGNWLARSASEADTVLIFFSGHGLSERDFGESYLLGYDSDPKDPYGTALSISEINQALSRRVRSGRVLVIADAVRRDFFDPDSDPALARLFEQAFDQLTASRAGVFAIVGSGPAEFSREGQRWGGHGVFTKHLVDVFMDGADRSGNVAIAAEELFLLLTSRIAEDTANKQHPWRSGKLSQVELARVEQPRFTATPEKAQPIAVASSATNTKPNPEPKKLADNPKTEPRRAPDQRHKSVIETKPGDVPPTAEKITNDARTNDTKFTAAPVAVARKEAAPRSTPREVRRE